MLDWLMGGALQRIAYLSLATVCGWRGIGGGQRIVLWGGLRVVTGLYRLCVGFPVLAMYVYM